MHWQNTVCNYYIVSFINPQDLKHTECVKLGLVFFYCVQIWLQVYFSCPYKSKNENKSDCTHCLKSPDWEGSSFSYGRVKCYKIIIRGKFTGGQELHCTCMNGKPGMLLQLNWAFAWTNFVWICDISLHKISDLHLKSAKKISNETLPNLQAFKLYIYLLYSMYQAIPYIFYKTTTKCWKIF